jgi:hypothetical protein
MHLCVEHDVVLLADSSLLPARFATEHEECLLELQCLVRLTPAGSSVVTLMVTPVYWLQCIKIFKLI